MFGTSGGDIDPMINMFLDSKLVIQRQTEADQARIKQDQEEIAELSSMKAGLDQFSDVVEKYEKSLKSLSDDTILNSKAAINTGKDLNLMIGNQSNIKGISLQVKALAQPEKLVLCGFASSSGVIVGNAAAKVGDFEITAAKKKVKISITSSDTMDTLAKKLSDIKGIDAVAFQEKSGKFVILISSQEAGPENKFVLNDSNGIFPAIKSIPAKDAVIAVNGIDVYRSKNADIKDILPGVTIDLKEISSKESLVQIARNEKLIEQNITESVAYHNGLIDLSQMKKVDIADDVLQYTNLEQDIVANPGINSIVAGIKFGKHQRLEIDRTKFRASIKKNEKTSLALIKGLAKKRYDEMKQVVVGKNGIIFRERESINVKLKAKNNELKLEEKALEEKSVSLKHRADAARAKAMMLYMRQQMMKDLTRDKDD